MFRICKFLTHMYIYSKKIYLDNDIYTVDHSSQIFIFDINGNFFGTISSGENDETIFGKINKVISGKRPGSALVWGTRGRRFKSLHRPTC